MGKKGCKSTWAAANLRKFASKIMPGVASNHLPKVDIVGPQSESETNQYSFDGLN